MKSNLIIFWVGEDVVFYLDGPNSILHLSANRGKKLHYSGRHNSRRPQTNLVKLLFIWIHYNITNHENIILQKVFRKSRRNQWYQFNRRAMLASNLN